jgi:hypothetical protein
MGRSTCDIGLIRDWWEKGRGRGMMLQGAHWWEEQAARQGGSQPSNEAR